MADNTTTGTGTTAQGQGQWKSRFPVARIKKIMQADEDVGKVAQVTPVAICISPIQPRPSTPSNDQQKRLNCLWIGLSMPLPMKRNRVEQGELLRHICMVLGGVELILVNRLFQRRRNMIFWRG
jgi:hypothetical protein